MAAKWRRVRCVKLGASQRENVRWMAQDRGLATQEGSAPARQRLVVADGGTGTDLGVRAHPIFVFEFEGGC